MRKNRTKRRTRRRRRMRGGAWFDLEPKGEGFAGFLGKG